MEKRPKNENELIQEGLERFLEQQLQDISDEKKQSGNVKAGSDTIQMIDLNRNTGEQRGFVPEDENGLDLDFVQQIPQRSSHVSKNSKNDRKGKNTQTVNSKKLSRRKEDKTGPDKAGKGKNMSGAKRNKKSKEEKSKKKKSARFKKFLVALVILILVITGIWYMMVGSIYQKMNYEEVPGYSSEPMKEEGVTNILLIGNDSRENGEDGRSDAMILVSISNKTKTITMTSLLRDMYVEIPGHDGNRLNAAYSYGGPELLMQTVEQNFDIPVHRYILVNFQAFANLVDAVGGVDLELTNEEVKYVNGYLVEYNMLENRPEGTDYLDESLSGMIHLNGPQALAYTRNRYIGTDFGRTERQRKVLTAVMKKLPVGMASNSGELIEGLFPNLTTNMSKSEFFRLSLDGSKLLTYELVQQAIPAEGTYSNATIRSMAVLEVDFEANKRILRESIYGE